MTRLAAAPVGGLIMTNHSDESPLAWVWSEYRAQLSGRAPIQVVEVVAVAERGASGASTSAAENPGAVPAGAVERAAGKSADATGFLLAALILTILGLLWFASSDKKTAPTVEISPAPALSSEPAPSPAAVPEPPAASAPAEPAPAATPAPAAPEPDKPAPRRPRRHR